MGTLTQQNTHQARLHNVTARLPWNFVAAGSGTPVIFSKNIESVARFTSDSGEALFRVRFHEPWALNLASHFALAPTVQGPEGEIYVAAYVTGALISTVAVDPLQEFDVQITILTATPTVAISNTVTAGAVVAGEHLVDQYP